MTLKAAIEISINFDRIKSRHMMRQGFIRYCLCLYYINPKTKKKTICLPYSIVRNQRNDRPNTQSNQTEKDKKLLPQSQIDYKGEFYRSAVVPIHYQDGDYLLTQTVCFKVYVDTDILDSVELRCEATLHFAQDISSKSVNVGNYEAVIRKLYNIGCYLPVMFDQFGTLQVVGSYHATVLEFKFQKTEDDIRREASSKTKQHLDFWSYVEVSTHDFNPVETRNFYNFYRHSIEQQYLNIQQRLSRLMSLADLQKNANRKQSTYQSIQRQSSQENILQKKSTTKKKYADIRLHQSPLRVSNQNQKVGNNHSHCYQKIVCYDVIPPNTQLIKMIQSLSTHKGMVSVAHLQTDITQTMLLDFTNIKAFMYKKWHKYTEYIHQNSAIISAAMDENYKELVKERFRNNIFSHRVKNHDWTFSKYEDSGKSHIQCANREKMKGNSDKQIWDQSFPVENIRLFGKNQCNLKMFEEIYPMPTYSLPSFKSAKVISSHQYSENITAGIKNKLLKVGSLKKDLTNQKNEKVVQSPGGRHLIVLVHGFQASRTDFLLLKACLEVNYDVEVMLSFCNEGKTEQSIEILGKRLAVEVAQYLVTLSDDYRISFIGHSMGGLIARSALTYLNNLEDRLYSYISICTPHLGYLYEPSMLVQAGLWLLNTWQKSESMIQICMNDHPQNPRQTFLYMLSTKPTLSHFKHVSFITSSQDNYVPYESARVEKNSKILSELTNNSSTLICEMVDNILQNLSVVEISRMDVVFNIVDQNLDSFIGRTGHVQFLSDTQFLKEFVLCFSKFFK